MEKSGNAMKWLSFTGFASTKEMSVSATGWSNRISPVRRLRL
jgi:hypothetical protein